MIDVYTALILVTGLIHSGNHDVGMPSTFEYDGIIYNTPCRAISNGLVLGYNA